MRNKLKFIFRLVFFILAYPMCLLFWIIAYVANKDSTFSGFSQALSLIPGKIGIYYRSAFYSTICRNVDQEVVIGFLTVFSHYDIEIEKGVYIGPQCNIGTCKIGQNTHIGSGAHILSGNKQHLRTEGKGELIEGFYNKVTIRENVWIGNLSTIMASVSRNVNVGASSCVSKCIVEESITVVGNPAKRIKSE